jgi:hypothetical protein
MSATNPLPGGQAGHLSSGTNQSEAPAVLKVTPDHSARDWKFSPSEFPTPAPGEEIYVTRTESYVIGRRVAQPQPKHRMRRFISLLKAGSEVLPFVGKYVKAFNEWRKSVPP